MKNLKYKVEHKGFAGEWNHFWIDDFDDLQDALKAFDELNENLREGQSLEVTRNGVVIMGIYL